MEGTNQSIKLVAIKNGGELARFYMKTDNILLIDVFEKIVKVPCEQYGINPLYCASMFSYTYQCGLKFTGNNL